MTLLHENLTRSVIGRFYRVYNTLGHGLLENPYVGAMEVELRRAGHKVGREVPIAVEYDGIVVGSYRVDLLVDNTLIVEVKAESRITAVHERQLLNYLKCSRMQLGLILLFGPTPEFRRFVSTASGAGIR